MTEGLRIGPPPGGYVVDAKVWRTPHGGGVVDAKVIEGENLGRVDAMANEDVIEKLAVRPAQLRTMLTCVWNEFAAEADLDMTKYPIARPVRRRELGAALLWLLDVTEGDPSYASDIETRAAMRRALEGK